MRRFWTIFKLMNAMAFRSKSTVFFSVLMPTMTLVLFGFVFGSSLIPMGGKSSFSYAIWLLPGVVVSNIMASGFMGNAVAMIAWRERGIFTRIAVTPMPLWQIMLARVCTQITVLIAQAVIAIIVGTLLFHFSFDPTHIPLTLLFLILGTIVFLALGQVIASLTTRVELGNIISQGVYIVFSFLTGVILPLELLPGPLSHVASYTPSYMAVSLLRGAMLQGTAGPTPLLFIAGLLAYCVVAIAISARFFKTVAH